jgi:hypothetical protein
MYPMTPRQKRAWTVGLVTVGGVGTALLGALAGVPAVIPAAVIVIVLIAIWSSPSIYG